MMRHEIEWSMLLPLRVQICLLSSVEFLCLAYVPCTDHCKKNLTSERTNNSDTRQRKMY